ncbi:MAG: hypothetical protein NTNFB02_08550 [Nitrospira sp.]
MAIHDSYTKEILEQLNYNATWLPTVQLAPGDVCDLRGHEIQVVSHLTEFKIAFELEDRPAETDIEYASAGAVSINFKASGDPPPVGSMLDVSDAGVSVSFSQLRAVVLRMAKCTSKRIKSLQKVGEQVLALHAAGSWPEDYVVITEIVAAGASTIIISNGESAGLDLTAKAGVNAGALTLASLDAGLQVKRESKIGAKFVAVPGLTPLVRVSGIQTQFLRPDRFRGAETTSPTAFVPVDYTDYPT